MVANKAYGNWDSPITAESLSEGATGGDITVDEATQSVYWVEVVTSEGGRGQIFSKRLGDSAKPVGLLPLEYNCRTRVHEYGGGSFQIKDGLLIFSNNADCRLYMVDLVNAPSTIVPLTHDNPFYRYADIEFDEAKRFIVCVREEHFENEEPKDVINTLVVIDLDTKEQQVIAQGDDFYSSPRLYRDQLTFVSWVHPNMPWDFTRLHHGKFEWKEGKFVADNIEWVVGKEIEESIVQPVFVNDTTIYFASDRSGFWNLYRFNPQTKQTELLFEKSLDQEFAGPAWRFNDSSFVPLRNDVTKLVCVYNKRLSLFDTTTKSFQELPIDYTHFSQLRTYGDNKLVLQVCSTTDISRIVDYDVTQQAITQELQVSSTGPVLDPSYISIGQELEFPTTNDKTAFCYYYPPKNPNYTQTDGLPPLRLLSHGGPTSNSDNAYSRRIQYWTTRGFAVADVNYGGSTGYGREFRNRLQLQWGIVDVDDCCNAALHLVKEGLVDGNKLAIEGGSAGGFTTLASVAFRNVFKAGCCLYGISDITLLAKETHKFESRYPDRLVGEYPKDKAVYEERSPLFSADHIQCPVIFFQGEEDRVVPASQSEIMVKTLKEKGIPVAYVLYPGEQHGFRRAENIKRTMELEQWFYGQIFGFPVEGVEGVEIFNFPASK
ncbi:alpha/beta-hydrolase [Backusella circina FSU 941]|nr:alpha/beta-hydrolase [Backusella circina FSU 941]